MPPTSQPWNQAIREIAEWLKTDRNTVVPFVGAGISRSANLPTWAGLAEAILGSVYGFNLVTATEVEAAKAADPLTTLSICRQKLGDEMFRRQVVSTLSPPKNPSVADIPTLCWRINDSFIVTTNLDDLLERASAVLDGSHATTLTAHDSLGDSFHQIGRRVLHLHGSLANFNTWIMTQADYDAAVDPASPNGAALQTLLLDRVLVFLGYSCNDPDLNLFLNRFKASFPKGTTQHYAMFPELPADQRRRLLDLGIFPIEYTPSSSTHPEVAQFLEELLTTFDPKAAELWTDQKANQPAHRILSLPSELKEMAFGPRRDRLNDEFRSLYDQSDAYALTGSAELPPPIKQRRAETLDILAGAWQVDSVPPLNALDGRQIVRELGRGGFGVVWEVEDIRTKEKQALKVAHFQETTNFKFVERFKQGIRAMRRLTNHRIASTTQYLGHREVPLCVFMEYVDGGDLGELIRNFDLASAVRLRIARDIARIVMEAHSVPVYHRDLKPSNVLIRWSSEGQPQAILSDFDLAWFEGAISRTTTRIGDQAFASPEQLREGRSLAQARAESDVYSLGMLILFAIKKVMPSAGQWYNQGLRAEMLATGLREFLWISTARRVADLVTRCASVNPSDRPNAKEVVAELDILCDIENSLCARPDVFATEVQYLAARAQCGDPFVSPQGAHLELRQDSGHLVVQVRFARDIQDSDDRGRFRALSEKRLHAAKDCLVAKGWRVESRSSSATEARLMMRKIVSSLSLESSQTFASEIGDGLGMWTRGT